MNNTQPLIVNVEDVGYSDGTGYATVIFTIDGTMAKLIDFESATVFL